MDQQARLALQRGWVQLLQGFGVEQKQAQNSFGALAQEYGSAGRVYHTLDHIQHMLGWLGSLRDYADDFPAVQLATWFHDCVYDPHASDNEEQSALYAQSVLTAFSFPGATIQAVSHLILATKTHLVAETDRDGALLLDADLAILGSPSPMYDAYSQAIRSEYHWVPTTAYNTARSQILRAFVQRPRIYLTEPMHTALETQARVNLQREIDALS